MKPEIITLPERMILGIPHRGPNDYAAIAAAWEELSDRIEEIDDVKSDTEFYGVCEPLYRGQEGITYLAGVEVNKVNRVPAGMQAWFISHQRYLAYPHDGPANTIGASFDKIYHEILPEMKLYPTEDYDIEVYSEKFYASEEPVIMLYVPVLSEPLPDRQSEPYRRIRQKLMDEDTIVLEEREDYDRDF